MTHKKTSKPHAPQGSSHPKSFVFGKENYRLMLIGLAVIVLGFILMTGTEDIYDFRKTALAPILVIAGFVIQIFAILKKSKEN